MTENTPPGDGVGSRGAASEERYRRTFENATIGMAHLAPDGRWIRVNERLCEILGYEESALLAKRYAEVSHLEDLELDVKQWELLRRGAISDYAVERRFVTKGGDIVHADVRLVREEDESGNLIHYIAVIQDITDRKRSEGILRVYGRALSATQNGVLISDAAARDHPIIYANQAFLEMTGYTEVEVIGRNCRFLNQRSRDQAALDDVRHALQHGEECSVLLRNHRKDGAAFWNQLSIAPVRDDDGRLTHFVGIQADVTDQVHAVAEREELLQSAEDANHAKNRFISVVSHELRSPLNAIVAWTSILRDEAHDPDGVIRAVEAIEASARSQTRLVNDLLDASRIRSRTLEVDPVGIELGSVVRGAVDQLTPNANEEGVALELRVEPGEVQALADPERVDQIVRNLVENALKFTPRGGRVDVSVTGGDDGCLLEVRDTGRGIAAEDVPRIFDEFWQALEGSGGRKGLGIGLAIVKHLVERHGGSIQVESEGLDRGACFRVALPKGGAAPGAHRPSVGAVEVDLHGAEVVVVDDDRATVEALCSVLAQAGAIPRPAGSVAEALDHFACGAPDLLISDIGLPHRDGVDLIRAVRDLEEPLRSLPALAVTGLADRDERRRIQRAGYDAYLAKPVEPSLVTRVLASLRALAAAEALPSRRVLVVGDAGGISGELARLCGERGQVVAQASDVAEAVRVAVDFGPELVLAGPPAVEDAATLVAELAAHHVRTRLVGVLEPEADTDPRRFDHELRTPLETAALERLLRFGAGAS